MRKLFVFLLSLLLLTFSIPSSVLAQENFQSREFVELPRDQVINKDYFATGEKVIISGRVNGDAYVAGGTVDIDGEINGDLLVAGGTVNIRGRVNEDIRAAGGQVNLSGLVRGNVTVVGGSVYLADSARLEGGLVAGTGSLSVFSPVSRDVTAGAGNLTLGSRIGGDVLAGVGTLSLLQNVDIAGNLTYWSENQASLQQGARVAGSTTQNMPPREARQEREKFAEGVSGAAIFFNLVNLVSSLVLGLLLLQFLPNTVQRVAGTLNNKPWLSLLIGFLAIIAFPVLFVILLATVLGIPIALILLFGFLVMIYLVKIFVSLFIGQKLANLFNWKKVNNFWLFILGLIIYGFLTSIPVLGALIWFIALLFGVGAILGSKYNLYQELRQKKLL